MSTRQSRARCAAAAASTAGARPPTSAPSRARSAGRQAMGPRRRRGDRRRRRGRATNAASFASCATSPDCRCSIANGSTPPSPSCATRMRRPSDCAAPMPGARTRSRRCSSRRSTCTRTRRTSAARSAAPKGVLTYQWRVQARDQVRRAARRCGGGAQRRAPCWPTTMRQARQLVTRARWSRCATAPGGGIDIAAGDRRSGSDGRQLLPTMTLSRWRAISRRTVRR